MFYYDLRKINQWENADYISRDNEGLIKCKLCNSRFMDKDMAAYHFNGSGHARNFWLIQEEQDEEHRQQCRIRTARLLQCRVDQLGYSRWKHHIQSLLYLYIFPKTDNTTEYITVCVVAGQRR